MFSPQITTSWVSHLSLAKMGPKTPNLGTFEVRFPPKSPPVGSPIFHWPKWVKKPPNWALLGCFPPPKPPTRLGAAMRTAWVGAAPFNPIMGLGGVSILCPPPQYIPYIPYIPNPKPEDFGVILGVILRVFCPGMNSGFNLN